MPAQIHRNNPVPPDEVIGLRREERAITCPPMHEDKGGLAGAAILKGQLDALVHNRRHASFSPFSRALTQPSLEGRCHRERSEAISSRLLRRCAPRNDGLFRDHRITQFTLHPFGDGGDREGMGAPPGRGRRWPSENRCRCRKRSSAPAANVRNRDTDFRHNLRLLLT